MPPVTTARARPAAAVLGLALAGCASAGGRAPLPDPGPGACRPTAEEASRTATLSVAGDGDVDPLRAPLPSSDAERLLFRQLYATLVKVDCDGRIRPGLAEDWSAGPDGARWTFRLASDARFADGSPVDAAAVVSAWHATDLSAGAGRPSPLDGASVAAPSERSVVVTLASGLRNPSLFAEPRFAVAGRRERDGWPVASGDHEPGADVGSGMPGRTVALVPRRGAEGTSRVRLVASGAAGARDLLDAGIDLLLTRDPGAASYAASLPGRRVHPLPWDRVWVLALPGGRPGGPGDGETGWEAVRHGLAGTAIPADARAAGDDPPWTACPAPDGPAGAGDRLAEGAAGRSPRPQADAPGHARPEGPGIGRGWIVHPADEASGRALAARLAALSGGAGPGGELVARALASGGPAGAGVRTRALAGEAYERSLRRGSAAGYLLALPRRSLAPCRLRREVLRRAPWLRNGGRVVPLVETRPLLVMRRGLAGLRLDWDGTPRLGSAGWGPDAASPGRGDGPAGGR